MKKYLFTMATAAMLFASCSSDDTVVDNGANEKGLVEIKLGTAIGTSVSEAGSRTAAEALEVFANTGVGIVAVSTSGTWATAGTPVTYLIQDKTGTVAADGANISFAEKIYYPRISDELGYDFFGYYPQTGLTLANGIISTGDVNFDGSADLLWAEVNNKPTTTFNGYNADYFNTTDNAEAPNLHFKHQTTRLKFVVVEGEDYKAETCAVTQLNVDVPQTYNLIVASQDSEKAAGTITWGEAEKQTVLFDTPKEVKEQGSTVTDKHWIGDIFVQPGQNSIALDLQIGGGENAVETKTVTLTNGNFEAGKAYTVTMTINGPQEIIITATLAAWDDIIDEGLNFEI